MLPRLGESLLLLMEFSTSNSIFDIIGIFIASLSSIAYFNSSPSVRNLFFFFVIVTEYSSSSVFIVMCSTESFFYKLIKL